MQPELASRQHAPTVVLALMTAEADLIQRVLRRLDPQGPEKRLVANVLEMLTEPTLSVDGLEGFGP